MIINLLRQTFEQNQEKPPLFLRNLLKQELQYYLLNYIFNSSYAQQFLFKGGTCLRFCFGLPRLSEDLDFDVEDYKRFNFDSFVNDIKTYFKNKLRYTDLSVSVSGVNKIIYLKFPVLGKIGFPVNRQKSTEDLLFVRIDLAPVVGEAFKKELSLKSSADFSFLIRRYSLADLYSGKIAAILQREKMEGRNRQPRFKGRDFFDIWFLKEKNISWNGEYLESLIKERGESVIREKLNEKIREAARRKTELKADLLPFFENPRFVEDFIKNLGYLQF